MNRMFLALFSAAAMAQQASAAFTTVPAEWTSSPLPAVATGNNANNGWYFCSDINRNPRVLVKSSGTGANTDWLMATGGPPTWTAGSDTTQSGINRQGVFLPTAGGGGYLVVPHTIGTIGIKVARFSSSGSLQSVQVAHSATVSGETYLGVSADVEADGETLHIAYIVNRPGQTNDLYYARRKGGEWERTSWKTQTTPQTPVPATAQFEDTAVIVNGSGSSAQPLLYFTYNFTGGATDVRYLFRAKPKEHPTAPGSPVMLFWGNNPLDQQIDNYIEPVLGAGRSGTEARVFYFKGASATSAKFDLKWIQGTGSPDGLHTGLNRVAVGNIRTAQGPDNKQRLAWYNKGGKKIHYYRPFAVSVDKPTEIGAPVVLTGSVPNADLQGLHLDSTGRPYILYSTAGNAGRIAFPKDDLDLNGNGRPDDVDAALNTTKLSVPEMLPVVQAVSGVGAGRFKFRFQTVGGTTATLGSLVSNNSNFKYSVETSDNLSSWTPISTAAGITYTLTGTTGTDRAQVQTYIAVLPAPEPATNKKRFARLSVTRLPNSY